MRPLRRLAAALLSVALAALVSVWLTPPVAWAVAGSATLSVSPSHGTADASLTLVYRVDQFPFGCNPPNPQATVDFQMDAPVLGTARAVDDGNNDGHCVATLHTKLPADRNYDKPGPHTIHTRQDGQDGYVYVVETTFTIDPTPTHQPTPTRVPTRAATSHPRTTAKAAVAAVTAAPATTTPPPAPASGVPPSAAAPASDVLASSAPTVPAIALRDESGGSSLPWFLGLGGVLILGGAVALSLFVRVRGRSARPVE